MLTTATGKTSVMQTRWRVWISLLMTCFFIVACTKPADHHEIRFAIAQAPINLDPRYSTDAASERVNRLIYQPLIDFDLNDKVIPVLATWVKQDPLHYRFTLTQKDQWFHDGTALTANDVVATYQSLLQLSDTPHAEEFANITSVLAVNDDTVDFTLRQPDEQFPARLVIGVMPAHLIASGHDFSHMPVGSGPLKLLDWRHTLKLERIKDGQPIVLEEVKDPTIRVLKLLRGEADLLQGDLSPELVNYLKQQTNISVREVAGSNFSYLGFNLQDRVLKNPMVRKAVALAIDRDKMMRHALVGGSRLATSILPPEHWASTATLIPYPYDPQQARKLLRQAGVKLPLKLVYKTSTDVQRVRLATIMQAQMKPAGIDLEIRRLDWGTFFDEVKRGQFQLYGLTWVGIKTPEIYRQVFHSASVPPKGANRGRYLDKTMDELIEKQNWLNVTLRAHAQLPYVPLWYEGQFAAFRKGIIGYSPAADGNWDKLAAVTRDE